jgi:hypothetical protein
MPKGQKRPEREKGRGAKYLKMRLASFLGDAREALDRTPKGWTREDPDDQDVIKLSRAHVDAMRRHGWLDRNFKDPKGFGLWREAEKVRKSENLSKLSVWANRRGVEALERSPEWQRGLQQIRKFKRSPAWRRVLQQMRSQRGAPLRSRSK